MELVVQTDISCPWCGELFSITVDTSQGDYSTVEDCSVCCRPIQLNISCAPGEVVEIEIERG